MWWRTNQESILKKILPAVVSIIQTENEIATAKKSDPLFAPLDFPFGASKSREETILKSGSGFFADSSGLILTSRHVFQNAKKGLFVVLGDAKRIPAKLISIDPIDDIAILKVEGGPYPIIQLGDSSRVELGEEVFAIGNALGVFENTVSKGIISGTGRSITTKNVSQHPINELRGLIQTDAAINIGNSGGPLVTMRGEAIGINTVIVAESQNLAFAIPINYAKKDLEDIKRYGTIRLPYLGLRYVLIDENMKRERNLKISSGALVTTQNPHQKAVIKDSPAERAGIKENDIIISCDGEPISQSYNIQDILERHSVHDTIKLCVQRKSRAIDIKVRLTERPR